MDITTLIVVILLIAVPVIWLFFSDKIVRFLGWVKEDDNSWLYPSNPNK